MATETKNEITKVISSTFERAANAVGVLTLLLSFGTLGISSFFFDYRRGIWLSLATFGYCGAIEVFHRQMQAKLDKRNYSLDVGTLVYKIVDRNPTWKPKVIEEFTYDGFHFRTIGFQEFPIPIGLTGPLCPRCKKEIMGITKVVFPGYTKIVFKCKCGFSAKSKKTQGELRKEASKLGGLPEK